MSGDAVLLDLLAAFAGALTAPLLAGVVLVAGLVIRRPVVARAAALALAVVHGGLDWAVELRPSSLLVHLSGSAVAAWLMVELVLQILRPFLGFARRLLVRVAVFLDRIV
jgi:hypothetical protein